MHTSSDTIIFFKLFSLLVIVSLEEGTDKFSWSKISWQGMCPRNHQQYTDTLKHVPDLGRFLRMPR